MKTLDPALNAHFLSALSAPGRSPEIPEESDLYGWLVGAWDLDVLFHWEDVSRRGLTAELHAAWVLEGRAIQDLWIMPRRPDRHGAPDPKADMYGTTLRIWDPSIQAWRIRWSNPIAGQNVEQIGRRNGDEIVQTGALPDGTIIRWRFTEIGSDAFHWIGDALKPDSRTWTLQGEFRARRR